MMPERLTSIKPAPRSEDAITVPGRLHFDGCEWSAEVERKTLRGDEVIRHLS